VLLLAIALAYLCIVLFLRYGEISKTIELNILLHKGYRYRENLNQMGDSNLIYILLLCIIHKTQAIGFSCVQALNINNIGVYFQLFKV